MRSSRADIALRDATPSPRRLSSPCDVITFQCSELRAGRDITSRSTLGAILPLHDVRYHASHTKPRGFPVDAKDVLADKPKTPAGGARRDRTDDLLLAKQALSQLSYGPGCRSAKVVGLGRLELPTSRLSSARSNQLSYKPNDRPHSSKTDAYGTGSSMKKEKRRRRCPANGPNRS